MQMNLGDTQYILWSMDPDKVFLDVSEEKKNNKKNHDFLFVGGKKVLHVFTSEKKRKRERKESILIKMVIYLANSLFT